NSDMAAKLQKSGRSCARGTHRGREAQIQRLGQIVDFHYGVTGTVHAAHNRGVRADLERRENGGLVEIGWSQAGLLDGGAIGVLPVIVRGDGGAVGIVQLEDRV